MSKRVKEILKNLSLESIFGIVFVLVLVFVIMENTYGIRNGVEIKISGIENRASYQVPIITVSGNAKHAKNLTVSGNSIPITINGDFETKIVLSEGINVVSFIAEDGFGGRNELTYTVYETDEIKSI